VRHALRGSDFSGFFFSLSLLAGSDSLGSMASQETSVNNFGLLIAYVLPGFTALQGLPYLSDSAAAASELVARAVEPTLAGFLYGTVDAITVGLTVSAVRWLVLDTLHHRTGLRPTSWDFALLEKNVAAFELLVHIHYRYYKFYANMVIALIWAYIFRGYALGWRGLVYLVLVVLFFLASRDALRKYYERAGRLLSKA
jgi:hypothetical protein